MTSNEEHLNQLLQDALDKENQDNTIDENADTMTTMPNMDGDPNRSLTPEEIEAMFAMSLNLEMSDDKEPVSEEENSNEEAGPETDQSEFDTVLDDLLDNGDSVSFESDLADLGDFSQSIQTGTADELDALIPEKETDTDSDSNSEIDFGSESDSGGLLNNTEEMEIDLDTVDDIDALLGLKEMPSDYKEGRKTAAHPEDVDIEGEDIDLLNALADIGSESDLDVNMDMGALSETDGDGAEDLEDKELSDLLDMLGGDDSELAEINDILKKSENNELVDSGIDDLDSLEDNLDINISADDVMEAENDEASDDDKKSRRKKKKKDKKDKKAKKDSKTDGDGEEKPKGFFGKIFEALTTEVEDDEENPEEVVLGENGEPLEPVKKEKKNKKAKGKKGKGKGAVSNEEILDEMDSEAGKKKEKKKKKPKKEKKVKEVVVEEPTKKLPKKNVISIFVLCASIFAIIFIVNTFIPKTLNLSAARKAYFNGEYAEAFEKMSGYKLNENDQLIYDKITILTKLDNKVKLYEAYRKANMKTDACNALIEAVDYYQNMSDKIDLYGIRAEASIIYGKVIDLLSSEYSLDINTVYELINADTVTYTKKLRYICGEITENPDLNTEQSTNSTSDSSNVLEDPLEAEFDN